jgi:hypothetical protein
VTWQAVEVELHKALGERRRAEAAAAAEAALAEAAAADAAASARGDVLEQASRELAAANAVAAAAEARAPPPQHTHTRVRAALHLSQPYFALSPLLAARARRCRALRASRRRALTCASSPPHARCVRQARMETLAAAVAAAVAERSRMRAAAEASQHNETERLRLAHERALLDSVGSQQAALIATQARAPHAAAAARSAAAAGADPRSFSVPHAHGR